MARNDEPGMPKPKRATGGGGKWEQYNPQANSKAPLWSEVNEEAILVAVANVTAAGGALLFGTTRDGGALALTLCAGELRKRFYAREAEEMARHLLELADRAP